MLRALDSVGVFAEDGQGRFTLTPLGATLLTDIPGSLRFFAIETRRESLSRMGEGVHSVQTGADCIRPRLRGKQMAVHGATSEEAMIFDEVMASFSSVVAAAVAEAKNNFPPPKRWWTSAVADGSLARRDPSSAQSSARRGRRRSHMSSKGRAKGWKRMDFQGDAAPWMWTSFREYQIATPTC